MTHPMLADPRLAHLPLVAYAAPEPADAGRSVAFATPPPPTGRPVFVPSPSRPLTVAVASIAGND